MRLKSILAATGLLAAFAVFTAVPAAAQGADKAPVLHKEPLEFENVHLSTRSYK